MSRSLVVGGVAGLLLIMFEGIVNANPFAARLFKAYQPIARSQINITAGILIDLIYGLTLAGLFILLYQSLPGSGWVKGLSFGLLVWFLRVAMSAASQWMMFDLPIDLVIYNLGSGLGVLLLLGLFYGLTLKHMHS